MKSTLETLSPTRVRLDVKVPYAELGEYVDAAYKKVGASVTIPGFRKGKVPNAMIDQRVGRQAVIDEAINFAIQDFYVAAARENDVLVVGRPTVDAIDFVDNEKLDFSVEVNVRPDVTLPDFSKIEISVDNVEVSDTDIEEQIDELRARFGTLNTVERAAANGDFVTIDLTARIDGAEVDGGKANEISYEVGSNKMIDNLDEALVGMSAGDTKTFTSQLVGQKDGESGEIDIVLKAVKERELPTLDDSFAKLASEFDTVAELRSDFTERLSRVKKMEQGAQARDLLVEKLLADLDIPVPDDIVLEEVNDHLEGEGRMEDAEHRAEVDGQVRASIKSDFLFDSIVKAEEVQVNEIELTEYLIRMSQRYGMGPEQFAQELQKAGQISQVVAEVTRAKALASVLARITVLDKSGNKVELEALRPQEAPDAPVVE
ncbi:trigger factor [Candidatus Planktophila dulcis]|uniref:trigger factor n=1 Tax=Candidatus Planktophila dulcis TaxID=1884914 RepID=UPI000BAC66CF|nr:trigger factor [Candidatus Planktophila dulcis]ASY14836.1 trigger factor [Candidatus Planktophila dulcis]